MKKVAGFIHGIYPRSAELVQISRDVDRKRLSINDLKQQQKIDFENLVKLEKSAHLDFLEDGKFAWQDIFRPLVESTEGIEAGALTRWFDNNCFFRQPIISGKIKLDEGKLQTYFLSPNPKGEEKYDGQWKVTLPSPFTFAKLTEDTKSTDFEKTLDQITKLLSDVLVYLNKKGVSLVQFNEPYIPYHQTKKSEIKLFLQSLAELKKVKGQMHLAVNTYFGDATPLVSSFVENNSVDVLGMDFYKTPLSSLPKKVPYDIIAGIVDGRKSLLEDITTLQKFVEKAMKHLSPKVFYLANNSDLELLPEPVAREKVKLLGEVTMSFRAKVA